MSRKPPCFGLRQRCNAVAVAHPTCGPICSAAMTVTPLLLPDRSRSPEITPILAPCKPMPTCPCPCTQTGTHMATARAFHMCSACTDARACAACSRLRHPLTSFLWFSLPSGSRSGLRRYLVVISSLSRRYLVAFRRGYLVVISYLVSIADVVVVIRTPTYQRWWGYRRHSHRRHRHRARLHCLLAASAWKTSTCYGRLASPQRPISFPSAGDQLSLTPSGPPASAAASGAPAPSIGGGSAGAMSPAGMPPGGMPPGGV